MSCKGRNCRLTNNHSVARARRRGIHGKGPKPYSREDRIRFVKELTKILSNFEGVH
ncbi:DUF188 domain-containing protein [Bacillus sp. FJAT-29937]|uniref:DUF188 domain-containing protein n=1 Tax=Bacillus sp. FJAT-29937 TaxID=1720553 RepID=UPI0012E3CD3B|nr:DUF188 domain-containing protein [Bacillus sp. FJAT-29937]